MLLLELANHYSGSLKFDTIGIADMPGMKNLLGQMARLGGGSFRTCASGSLEAIQTTFAEISTTFTQTRYEIVFRPTYLF